MNGCNGSTAAPLNRRFNFWKGQKEGGVSRRGEGWVGGVGWGGVIVGKTPNFN